MKVLYNLEGLAGTSDIVTVPLWKPNPNGGDKGESAGSLQIPAADLAVFKNRQGGWNNVPVANALSMAMELYFINRKIEMSKYKTGEPDFSPGASAFIRSQGIPWPDTNKGRAEVAVAIWAVTGCTYIWGKLLDIKPSSYIYNGEELLASVQASGASGAGSLTTDTSLTTGAGTSVPTTGESTASTGSSAGVENSEGLPLGVKVGIAVGVVAVVGALVFVIVKKRKRQQ